MHTSIFLPHKFFLYEYFSSLPGKATLFCFVLCRLRNDSLIHQHGFSVTSTAAVAAITSTQNSNSKYPMSHTTTIYNRVVGKSVFRLFFFCFSSFTFYSINKNCTCRFFHNFFDNIFRHCILQFVLTLTFFCYNLLHFW